MSKNTAEKTLLYITLASTALSTLFLLYNEYLAHKEREHRREMEKELSELRKLAQISGGSPYTGRIAFYPSVNQPDMYAWQR